MTGGTTNCSHRSTNRASKIAPNIYVNSTANLCTRIACDCLLLIAIVLDALLFVTRRVRQPRANMGRLDSSSTDAENMSANILQYSTVNDVVKLLDQYSQPDGLRATVYDSREVDEHVAMVRQWVTCKEAAWYNQLKSIGDELEKERAEHEKFQFLHEDVANSLSATCEEVTRLKSDNSKLKREVQNLQDERRMLQRQLEVDHKQAEQRQKDDDSRDQKHRQAMDKELVRSSNKIQELTRALNEAVIERDRCRQELDVAKDKHRMRRRVWHDQSACMLRCLESQTTATSTHLAEISKQLAPGGALRASLDAASIPSAASVPAHGWPLNRQSAFHPATGRAGIAWDSRGTSECSSPRGSVASLPGQRHCPPVCPRRAQMSKAARQSGPPGCDSDKPATDAMLQQGASTAAAAQMESLQQSTDQASTRAYRKATDKENIERPRGNDSDLSLSAMVNLHVPFQAEK